MSCPKHTAGVGSCNLCTNYKRYEAKILLMGPRTVNQHKDIADSFNVPPFTFCIVRNQKVYHKLHYLAEDIYVNCRENVDILKETGSAKDTHTFFEEMKHDFLKSKIQLVPGRKNVVRAKTRLGILNCNSLTAYVKNQGIRGVSIMDICAEYENAYLDVQLLIKKGEFWETNNCVWHESNVVKQGTEKQTF